MLSFYRLILRRSYWRRFSLKAFWHAAWISLRRSHKDPRARKFLAALAFLLLLPVICIVYLIWFIRSGAIFLIPFILPALWWIRSRHKRNELVHIAPQPDPLPAPPDNDYADVREYLGKMTVLYAVMLDRAGSESFLREKELPPNIEVVSRRTHIDLLQHAGIWDNMSADDRQAMMLPDREWDPERIAFAISGVEPFRLLRWILRIDFFLPVIGRQLRFDYGSAHQIVLNPKSVLESKNLISAYDLQIAHRAAEEYFYRCAAESIARGHHETENAKAKAWAAEVSQSLTGKQGDDLLLGAKIVSEVDSAELFGGFQQARIRMNFLAWVQALISGSTPPVLPFAFPTEPQPAIPEHDPTESTAIES